MSKVRVQVDGHFIILVFPAATKTADQQNLISHFYLLQECLESAKLAG